jgi:hypothetical protein
LIHRDLKPGNILVDDKDHVWVADFGLALSLANDSLIDAQQASVEGTPHYMSPAVAAGEMEDTRCDIYSFGAVLYELLAGQAPYHGFSAKEVLEKIKQGPPPPLVSVNPRAAPGLVRIAEKAMARELSERYVHMRYVEADLSQGSDGRGSGKSDAGGASKGALAFRGRLWPWGWLLAGLFLLVFAGWIAMDLFSPRRPAASAPSVPAVAPSALGPLNMIRVIERPGMRDWRRAVLVNFYPVGPPLMAVGLDKGVSLVSLRGDTVAEFRTPDPYGAELKFQGPVDVNRDQVREYLLSWSVGSNVMVSVFSGVAHELKRFQTVGSIDRSKPGVVSDTGVEWARIDDLDGDGRPEVVALLASGYAGGFRGICVWDYPSGQELWRYEMAPIPSRLEIADFNGDGKRELLMGSAAVENGKQLADGTDDTNAFVYCLDSAGKLRWRTWLGDNLSKAFPEVLDLDHDGQKEILVWLSTDSEMRAKVETRDLPRVVRMDPGGGVTHRFGGTGVDLVGCIVADLDRDGRSEVLAGDNQGWLYCLNADLSVRRKTRLVEKRYDDVKLAPCAAEDLDNDGTVEIVVTAAQMQIVSGMNPGRSDGEPNQRIWHDNDLMILDPQFRRLAAHRLAEVSEGNPQGRASLADTDGDGRKEILLMADKVYVLSYTR